MLEGAYGYGVKVLEGALWSEGAGRGVWLWSEGAGRGVWLWSEGAGRGVME